MSVGVNPPKTPVTKGSMGIAMATVPNVCKMPGPPAPFVPTPLPNIGKSGMSPKGYTKKVKVKKKNVAIRGATFKSMGDVASKATGGGLISMNTHGPTKFAGPGSLNVKFEGKNVQLLSDIMLNNCGASGNPPNSATMAGVLQAPNMPDGGAGDADRPEKCKLKPYSECKNADGKTGHHCVPDHCFKSKGKNGEYYPGAVKHKDGLCVLLEGATKSSTPSGTRVKRSDFRTDKAHTAALAQHGKVHKKFDKLEKARGKKDGTATLGQLEDDAAKVISEETGCDEADLKKQMRDHHQRKGLGPDTKLRADPTGHGKTPTGPMGVTNLADSTGMPG